MTMKNLLLIGTFLLILTGCTKEAMTPEEETTINDKSNVVEGAYAKVNYMGNPALDGFGWVLAFGDDFEVPNNLADNFKNEGLGVKVSFKRTAQPVPCRCTAKKMYVQITAIEVSE